MLSRLWQFPPLMSTGKHDGDEGRESGALMLVVSMLVSMKLSSVSQKSAELFIVARTSTKLTSSSVFPPGVHLSPVS